MFQCKLGISLLTLDHYRNGMVQNSDTLMNNTVDAFLSDLKRAKVYDVFNGADVELQDLIVREIRIASGCKLGISLLTLS
jgi:hypothetical protein